MCIIYRIENQEKFAHSSEDPHNTHLNAIEGRVDNSRDVTLASQFKRMEVFVSIENHGFNSV